MEREVDEFAIRLLALRQPVVNDLRAVVSALRIANELERVCDYAADFAERFITLQARDGEPMRTLVRVGRFAVHMLKDAMQSYGKRKRAPSGGSLVARQRTRRDVH